MQLPEAFCWSKFGTEAGDEPTMILRRKDRERELNNGVFLWGIGNSIWPSLKVLVRSVTQPRVVFTPMLSGASKADSSPSSVVLWRRATAFDHGEYEIPKYSTITSRGPEVGRLRAGSHYALVCKSDSALRMASAVAKLDHLRLRNLASGSPVGSSQVTSVVETSGDAWSSTGRYNVAFVAELVDPYFVRLMDPVSVPTRVRTGVAAAEERAFDALRELRATTRNLSTAPTLW